ncbi:type I-E CRISPR-associated protein Cas6/Cse3/CasE [Enterobacter sp.]|uniref:type I-E CRISPR-associated protein Cas6/Cse3/CasE n=1 Tax=Enterobacter sp. TaxID=42895 RepID=UPI00296F9E6F|nr:type I-E CRISPR-associated protein Cas6/Cse3/CasE [Enterobacter sp.]
MTLYISTLRLDARAHRKLRITDGYSLHRVVYDLFEDVRSEEQKHNSVASGIQWVDKGGDLRGRRILIMADRPPREPAIGELETKILPDTFLTHSHYRFTVCLNPTRRDKQSGKQTPVRGREAIGAWFCQRAASWGFQVDPQQIQVDGVNVMQFTAGETKTITLQQATLSGRLTVTEPEMFKASFKQGLGRARAFGCGLLQIVPLPETPYFD